MGNKFRNLWLNISQIHDLQSLKGEEKVNGSSVFLFWQTYENGCTVYQRNTSAIRWEIFRLINVLPKHLWQKNLLESTEHAPDN